MSDHVIAALPKAELHVHVEGTFEPELMLAIAKRNGVLDSLPFTDVAAARKAYKFNNLQEFLDLYYAGCGALLHEQDFYDLAWAYLERAAADGVVLVELMFDPQTHTKRGVPFSAVVTGLHRALTDAGPRLGVEGCLCMQFLRDLGPEGALQTLKEAEPFRHLITAVGLDSTELPHPPSLFRDAFSAAKQQGYRLSAHAGEEGPAGYVWEAVQALDVERIDHGVHSIEDPALLAHLRERQLPLTLCPLSNLKLKVYDGELPQRLRELLGAGLLVTVNSGYINANYAWLRDTLGLGGEAMLRFARAGFQAAFISEERRQQYLARADAAYQQAVASNGVAANGHNGTANGHAAAANGHAAAANGHAV